MSALSDLIVGSSQKNKTTENSQTFEKKNPNPRQRQMFDILQRALVGQMVEPPETAISVPQQQALSYLQGIMPSIGQTQGSGGSLAGRLSGSGGNGSTASGGFNAASPWLPTAQSGQPAQMGLQSREQMGLPPRSSYMPEGFVPSADEVKAIGLAPVRAGSPAQQRQRRREQRQQRREQRQSGV